MDRDALLARLIAPLGLTVTRSETFRRFSRYCDLLLETNAVMNLTAVTEPEAVYVRHFADSLAPAAFLPTPERFIDVGCGAGFPGLPLKLLFDDAAEGRVHLTLLDSTAKKIDFLRRLTEELALSNVSFETRRAEEAAADPALRETFDLAVSRAVAAGPALCELCLPFVRVGGRFAAHKSARAAEELAASAGAVRTLGGAPLTLCPYVLDGAEQVVAVSEKRRPTPAAYPRPWARIKKRPL